MDIIPGFAPCIVVKNDDPEGAGRIKVSIPGKLAETPYWVEPSWPGASGPASGTRYPPPAVGSPVSVIFAFGDYLSQSAKAVFITGYYGQNPDGTQAGPPTVAAAGTAAQANQRICLWEDADFRVMIHNDLTDPAAPDKKILLQAKARGTKIEINAADGNSGKAETITIEAASAVSIYAQGLIDIASETQVKIQGRVVNPLTEKDI